MLNRVPAARLRAGSSEFSSSIGKTRGGQQGFHSQGAADQKRLHGFGLLHHLQVECSCAGNQTMGENLGVDAFRDAAGFLPQIAHRAANPVMMLSLVGAGLGMAVVPAAKRNGAPSSVAFVAADPPLLSCRSLRFTAATA